MPKIKIEHTLRRPGGTEVTMRTGNTYHFKPSETDPRHMADVEDTRDITRFLSVGEDTGTFRMVDAEIDSDTSGGPSGGGGAKGAVPDEPERNVDTNPVLDAESNETNSEPQTNETVVTDLSELGEDDLRDLFEKEVGRKPSPKAKKETLIAQIEQAREDGGKND